MSSPVKAIPDDPFMNITRTAPTLAWQNHLQILHDQIQAVTTSGTSAQRPTRGLYVGRTYFDVTLGFEIHYNGTQWVKYDGTPA